MIPDWLAWVCACALLVRCVCVVNRIKVSTWRKSLKHVLFNLAVLAMTISCGLAAFSIFYDRDTMHMGFAMMVVFSTAVCFLDTRNNWRERKHWVPRKQDRQQRAEFCGNAGGNLNGSGQT